MALFTKKEVLTKKLSSIKVAQLRELASQLGVSNRGSASEIIKRILKSNPDETKIDTFIVQKYRELVEARRSIISDDDLKKELLKVKTFSWGVVQGQLDQKIQSEYVRRIVRYNDLLKNVKDKLHDDITNYVICTWFNHWTTVLIEDHISLHKRVIPTIKNIKGIDIFFDGQPFDLKVTYLPRDYDTSEAVRNPSDLAVWMYEHQGAQRFGYDNRLFVILLDKEDRNNSWKLKRDFDLVFKKIDDFFDNETISQKDEITFTFGRKMYTTIAKVLIITK